MPDHDGHHLIKPLGATYSGVYRQVVVTLREVGAFSDLREQLYKLLDGVDYDTLAEVEDLRLVAVQVAPGEDVARLIRDLSRARIVAGAEQNRPAGLNAAIVNDPRYREQWALQKIAAEPAWLRARAAIAANAAPVVVGIVDTGISITHPDLAGHLWTDGAGHHGLNLLAGSFDVPDPDGHGTLLAGTIGAISNNAQGIAAAEWPIRLMTVKFHDVRVPPTALAGALAIWWAAFRGAKVINAAWDVGVPRVFLRNAIQFAGGRGAVVVAAAGNDGLNNDKLATYPANYGGPPYNLQNVISVMASDKDDDKPGFSNYGRTTVHLAAPGVRILSTHSFFLRERWREYSGTSAACAHVAYAAALLKVLNPAWTPLQIREHLVASVHKSRWLDCVAGGRLDLERAVCGPLQVTAPRTADEWPANTNVQVTWSNTYPTPRCTSVKVLLSENSGPYSTVLASGKPNNGACTVAAPNRNIPHARLKLVSEQGPGLYSESAVFKVKV